MKLNERIFAYVIVIVFLGLMFFLGPMFYWNIKAKDYQIADYDRNFDRLNQLIATKHYGDVNVYRWVMSTDVVVDYLEQIRAKTGYRYRDDLVSLRRQGNIQTAHWLLVQMFWWYYPPAAWQQFLDFKADHRLTWEELKTTRLKAKEDRNQAIHRSTAGLIDWLREDCSNWNHKLAPAQLVANMLEYLYRDSEMEQHWLEALWRLDEKFADVAKKCRKKIPPQTLDP